jgi:hypothetical protein
MKLMRLCTIIITIFIFLCAINDSKAKSLLDISDPSKDARGYILYVFAKRTEVMVDFCKKDGLTNGTKLDVIRPKVEGMDEPVKLGEITVEKVGDKMSKAKVSLITSSLKMEKGDRVYPHPIVVVSDESWIAQKTPEKGWRSEINLPNERNWTICQVIPDMENRPTVKRLITDTNAKPVWHPGVSARTGDVFFRKVFTINANATSATLDVICGGKVNIYLNDSWVGEVKEPVREEEEDWPKITSFKVRTFLRKGRNIIAVQVFREPKSVFPPVLLLAIKVQTSFR